MGFLAVHVAYDSEIKAFFPVLFGGGCHLGYGLGGDFFILFIYLFLCGMGLGWPVKHSRQTRRATITVVANASQHLPLW